MAAVTLIIGYALSMVLPIRVSADTEREGLDIASHQFLDQGLSRQASLVDTGNWPVPLNAR